MAGDSIAVVYPDSVSGQCALAGSAPSNLDSTPFNEQGFPLYLGGYFGYNYLTLPILLAGFRDGRRRDRRAPIGSARRCAKVVEAISKAPQARYGIWHAVF